MSDYKIKTVTQDAKPSSLSQAIKSINQTQKEREVSEKAKSLQLDYINLLTSPINSDALFLIPHEKASTGRIVAYLQVGKRLRLALEDPSNPTAQEIISYLKQKGYILHLSLASPESLERAISIYGEHIAKHQTKTENILDESHLEAALTEIQKLKNLDEKIQKSTSAEGINAVLMGALRSNVSDIHFQPEDDKVQVLFRIDGLLQHIVDLSLKSYEKILPQIKHDSHMKINVTNIPQDGDFSFTVNNRRIDIRVSTLPTETYESIVFRLLDSRKGQVDFKTLGFPPDRLSLLEKALTLPHGLILSTGPTGSGKTTTLYAMLNRLHTPDRKIITLEDPVEYHLPGIVQSEINEEENFTFSSGLRAILRQDPDIIMVGEIRDGSTATAAVEAALTGHIVLSTLHTNSALEAIPRLIELGVAPFLFSPALNIIIAQRLVRLVCPHCTKTAPPTKEQAAFISEIKSHMPTHLHPHLGEEPSELATAVGCEKCGFSGYHGRSIISEILDITPTLRHAILKKAETEELLSLARQNNYLLMQEDALRLVFKKQTTLTEIIRVIGEKIT